MEVLIGVKKILKERGFKCFLDMEKGGIVVPLRVDDYLAEFLAYEDGNGVRALGIVYDVGSAVDRKILEEILKVPTKFKVSISLDDDGDLIFDVWHTLVNPSVENVVGAFILFTKFVKWLIKSLNGDVKPFLNQEE